MLFVRFALAGMGGVPWTVVAANVERLEFVSENVTTVTMVSGETRDVEGSITAVVALCGGTISESSAALKAGNI